MKGKLFAVRLEDYKTFYVMANDYTDAANKIEAYIESGKYIKKMFDSDASLIKQDESHIRSVELLTDELIY